jgi:hypothetical protein
MIGSQNMTLTHESVKEALTEYINRHLKPEHEQQLESWAVTPNVYGPPTLNVVLLAPHVPEAVPQDSASGGT